MIRSIKNAIPRITFTNHPKKWLVVVQNKTVTIWLSTVYNKNVYETSLVTELQHNKISEYQYEVTADLKGFNKIELAVSNKDKTKQTSSNSLILIVV